MAFSYKTIVYKKDNPSKKVVNHFEEKIQGQSNGYDACVETFKEMDKQYPEWTHKVEKIFGTVKNMSFEEFLEKLPTEYFAVKVENIEGHATVFWKKYPNGMPKYIDDEFEAILEDLARQTVNSC